VDYVDALGSYKPRAFVFMYHACFLHSLSAAIVGGFPANFSAEGSRFAVERGFSVVAHWCFDNTHMQELKVWSSFIHLPN